MTLAHARRRGVGSARTSAALGAARSEGYRIAVLQASAARQGIYARLGFVAWGQYIEYKP
ncbi:MAG: hypothetical protein M3P51_11455 [Chloroflexota bacterium]|nr:hypothetical protein [Chloroflexota bacterium]